MQALIKAAPLAGEGEARTGDMGGAGAVRTDWYSDKKSNKKKSNNKKSKDRKSKHKKSKWQIVVRQKFKCKKSKRIIVSQIKSQEHR